MDAVEANMPENIDDILNDPALAALLADGEDVPDIFDLKHVPATQGVNSPDYVARRVTCDDFDDFDDFEPLLIECQKDLKEKRRRLLPFANEQNIEAGHFYVLKGVLLYVAEVGKREQRWGGLHSSWVNNSLV